MEISNAKRTEVFAALQGNFDAIFTSENVTATEVVEQIDHIVQS